MEPQPQPQSKSHREAGIIKQWNAERKFGIVYSPGGRRYFLHKSNVIEGTPDLGRRVTFDVGEARTPTELKRALNVQVGDMVGVSL